MNWKCVLARCKWLYYNRLWISAHLKCFYLRIMWCQYTVCYKQISIESSSTDVDFVLEFHNQNEMIHCIRLWPQSASHLPCSKCALGKTWRISVSFIWTLENSACCVYQKALIRAQRMQATEIMFRIFKWLCVLMFSVSSFTDCETREALHIASFWYGCASLLISLLLCAARCFCCNYSLICFSLDSHSWRIVNAIPDRWLFQLSMHWTTYNW